MSKAGGKGRISNELVAASCAAVLAVYGAGYWRTRDDTRRIDIRTQERPARPLPPPARAAAPAPSTQAPRVTTTALNAAVTTASTEPLKPIPPASLPEVSPPATSAPASHATPDASEPAPIATLAAQPAAAQTSDMPAAPSGNWRDGTYTGWGTSRHGDIKAQVVIHGGRIVEAGIASCETRYPCDVIGDIIPQPVARQSPDVDRVSRATESADAYYFGLVEALKEAQIPDAAEASAPR